MSEKQFCLTLDLENDWYFDEPGYDHLTLEYLDEFIELIQDIDVPLSIFVVGKTLEKYPEEIDRLDEELDCEFHLHSYRHDTSKSYDFREEIQRGKDVFYEHFGANPRGYRAPQWNIEERELAILDEEGFDFDSSVMPSYRPGVYQNLGAPTTPYQINGPGSLLEIPPGVMLGTRVPQVHSYSKLVGRAFQAGLSVTPLPDTIVYTVHLQDLYRTDSFDNLSTLKRSLYDRNMSHSVELLKQNIEILRGRGYVFTSMNSILQQHVG
ncbi:polysaccharide deacetylase [Halorubrum gandharaense]